MKYIYFNTAAGHKGVGFCHMDPVSIYFYYPSLVRVWCRLPKDKFV